MKTSHRAWIAIVLGFIGWAFPVRAQAPANLDIADSLLPRPDVQAEIWNRDTDSILGNHFDPENRAMEIHVSKPEPFNADTRYHSTQLLRAAILKAVKRYCPKRNPKTLYFLGEFEPRHLVGDGIRIETIWEWPGKAAQDVALIAFTLENEATKPYTENEMSKTYNLIELVKTVRPHGKTVVSCPWGNFELKKLLGSSYSPEVARHLKSAPILR